MTSCLGAIEEEGGGEEEKEEEEEKLFGMRGDRGRNTAAVRAQATDEECNTEPAGRWSVRPSRCI